MYYTLMATPRLPGGSSEDGSGQLAVSGAEWSSAPGAEWDDVPQIEIVVPQLHRYQQRVDKEARRFSVLVAGRRWGKDVWQLQRVIDPCLYGYPTAWLFPTYKMLGTAWREVKTVLQPLTRAKWEDEHRIELVTRGSLDMWSLENPDAPRGRKYKRIIVNEAGEVADLQYAWEYVLRPTLADYRGDAVFCGTPKGLNYFFDLYQRGQGAREDWISWRFPSSTNPFLAKQEIEDARLELPERAFAQEWLAEFLEDAGAVFRNLSAVLRAPVAQPKDHKLHRVVMGLDWGKELDFTAASIGCADCAVEIARDRFNQVDYVFQRQRIHGLISEWGVKGVLPERNAMGQPIIEQMLREGVPILTGPDEKPGYQTTAVSKPPLIENLALKIERGQWLFQPDELWRLELMAYNQKRNPKTGQASYYAPEGKHDDTVVARALMVWAAGNYRHLPETQPVQESKWRQGQWEPMKRF